jgi:hypothetical protein
MSTWFAALLPLLFISLALGFLFRKLAARTRPMEFDAAWLEDFSIAKYRPMLRLLSEDDYEFLSNQAGYQGRIASELRSERRKVFRAYLRNLVRDFGRLHHFAKMMAAYSAQDRPELGIKLLMQKVTFTAAVAAVRLRLALHTVGIGTVDVRNLVNSLDHMRSNVDSLLPSASPAS